MRLSCNNGANILISSSRRASDRQTRNLTLMIVNKIADIINIGIIVVNVKIINVAMLIKVTETAGIVNSINVAAIAVIINNSIVNLSRVVINTFSFNDHCAHENWPLHNEQSTKGSQ